MEENKYTKLCPNGKPRMIVGHKSSIRNHSKSYDYENNKKYRQKPKIQEKSARRSCQRLFNHKLFSENFTYDSMNLFSKPM